MLEVMEQMDQVYDRWSDTGDSQSGSGRGVLTHGFRCHRYLGSLFGTQDGSSRRHS